MLTIQSRIENSCRAGWQYPRGSYFLHSAIWVLRGLVKNWPVVKAAQDSAKQAVDYLSQLPVPMNR